MTKTEHACCVISSWLALGLVAVWALRVVLLGGGTSLAAGLMVLLALLGTLAATFTLFAPWTDRRSEDARAFSFLSYLVALGLGALDVGYVVIRALVEFAMQK